MSLRNVAPDLFKTLDARAKLTPDLGRLKYFENTLVFVYGTLQRGHENYKILADSSRYLGIGHTVLKNFSMYDTLNGFPMVFPENTLEFQGYIKGEVWAVSPDTLAQIDRLENNGEYYRRQKTFVCLDEQIVPSKDNMHPVVDCQIYLGMNKMAIYQKMQRYFRSGQFFYQWYRADSEKFYKKTLN